MCVSTPRMYPRSGYFLVYYINGYLLILKCKPIYLPIFSFSAGAVENEDGEDGDKNKKAKRKKKSATVEKNLNNIDIAKFDLEFDVDPLFKKTSTQFDSGGGGSQFLCNLFIRDESCQLLLDSEDILSCKGKALAHEEDLAEDMVKIETNENVSKKD